MKLKVELETRGGKVFVGKSRSTWRVITLIDRRPLSITRSKGEIEALHSKMKTSFKSSSKELSNCPIRKISVSFITLGHFDRIQVYEVHLFGDKTWKHVVQVYNVTSLQQQQQEIMVK